MVSSRKSKNYDDYRDSSTSARDEFSESDGSGKDLQDIEFTFPGGDLHEFTCPKLQEFKVAQTTNVLARATVLFCAFLSWSLVLFVPIWKIVDTSYLFRESQDPSMFDQAKEEFSSDSKWPFASYIDDGKDTYRVYVFIVPFAVAFFFLFLKGLVAVKWKVPLNRPHLPNFFRFRFVFGLTGMDLTFLISTLVYSALLVWARTKRALTRGANKLTFMYVDGDKEPINPFSWQATEVMALSLGVLSIVLLGWFVLMPISRRSVLLQVFDIPWEVAVKYHRWLGWYSLAAFLAHMITYIALWTHVNGDPVLDPEGNLLRHMMVPGSCNDGSCDSDTGATGKDTKKLHYEMMYGYASLFVMLFMSAFSIKYIRRHYFEAFYFVHQLFRLMIVFLCLHYKKTMLYLLPGVVMILVDKTIGYLSLIGSVEAKAHPCTKDIFEIKVKKDPTTRCEAGQYVFVNVPSISLLEWHPITVTWATEIEIAIHIKTRGPGSWTQKVMDEVCAKGGHLNVKLDGFYGSNQIEAYSLLKKEAVVLFCGGCGLTFPFGIIMELCRSDVFVPVYLCWITRTTEEYLAFEYLLLDAKDCCNNLSIMAWVTLSGQSSCDGGVRSQDDEDPRACTYFPATAPSSVPTDISNTEDIVWRPFTAWLWPVFVHAGVIAFAILVGILGYALSRSHEIDESVGEPRATLTDRFFDCLIVVLIVSGLVYVLIGIRLLIRVFWGSQTVSDVRRPPLGTSHVGVSYPKDLEPGQSPFIVGLGNRPNMESVFKEIASVHPENVAVLGCGPRPMTDAVKDECQKRVWDSWVVSDEEWEW